jgi:hypothetical protein
MGGMAGSGVPGDRRPGDFVGPRVLGEDYRRWGYPGWFRFVTGGLLTVSGLLMLDPALLAWLGFRHLSG